MTNRVVKKCLFCQVKNPSFGFDNLTMAFTSG